jgi:hypothetical protein
MRYLEITSLPKTALSEKPSEETLPDVRVPCSKEFYDKIDKLACIIKADMDRIG